MGREGLLLRAKGYILYDVICKHISKAEEMYEDKYDKMYNQKSIYIYIYISIEETTRYIKSTAAASRAPNL